MNRIKYFILRNILTENEKCMLNQALNEQDHQLKKDYARGTISHSDFNEDRKELNFWRYKVCRNSLWN